MTLVKVHPFHGPSFTLLNRFTRLLWQCVWIFLFRPTPPQMHLWRCWLLKCFGARIAPNCYVYSDVQIWAPWHLTMHEHSMLGRGVVCYSMAPVSIGKRVVVSWGARLCTGSHDYESENFQLFSEPIVIGNDVWICAEAFIGPGVSIGTGSVIGARSVVTRDQPAWMVCAGNPCRPLKIRRSPSYAQV